MTTAEKMKTKVTTPSDLEIVVTRTFDAPRDLIWDVWTKAEHLTHWWGPKGWTLPVCEVDFRPGGTWFYCMQDPEGTLYCGKGFYHKIDARNWFVYRDTFVDSEGQPMEGMPVSEITVEFSDDGNKTLVKSTSVYATKSERDAVIEMGVEDGIGQTYDRLESYLKTVK